MSEEVRIDDAGATVADPRGVGCRAWCDPLDGRQGGPEAAVDAVTGGRVEVAHSEDEGLAVEAFRHQDVRVLHRQTPGYDP
jgi:hypothetical protein